MTAQAGINMILKSGTAAGGTQIAGMRSNSMQINGEAVDVTTKDSAGARTLLAGAGIYSCSMSVSGVVSDNDDLLTLAGYAKARSLNAFGIVFGDGDSWDANWQITDWQVQGDYNSAQTFSCTFQSSGAVTITTV